MRNPIVPPEKKRPPYNIHPAILGWLIIGTISWIFLTLSCQWGIGMTSDSITYITGARSIIENINLSKLPSHYPPLYPILIAITGYFSSNLLSTTLIFHTIIYLINIFVVGFLLLRETKSHLISILGMAVTLLSLSLLKVHVLAWSESTFFLFAMFGFYFLSVYFSSKKLSYLIYSGVLINLAFLTRYAGVTLIITCSISLLLFNSSWKKRLFDNGIFLAFSTVPMAIWLLYNHNKGSATNRSFVFHPISFDKIQQGINTIGDWFFIPSVSAQLLVPLLFIIILSIRFLILTKNKKTHQLPEPRRLTDIFLLFIPIYLAFLIFSISFFDAHTPLDNRILSPVYLFFLLASFIVCHQSKLFFSKTIHGCLLFSLVLVSIANIPRINQHIIVYNKHGIGFASREWSKSPILHFVKNLPKEVIIFTNGPDPLQIHLARKSSMIPRFIDPLTREANQNFNQQIQTMLQTLRKENGIIVYFRNITWRWYLPKVENFLDQLPVTLLYSGNDGVVFTISAQGK